MRRMGAAVVAGWVLVAWLMAVTGIACAADSTAPPLPAIALEPVVSSDLRHPVYVAHAGDGS